MSVKKMLAVACTLFLALPTAGYSQLLLYDGFSGDDYAAGPADGIPYGGAVNGYEVGGEWNNNDFEDGGLEHDSALVTTPGVRVVRTSGDMEGFLDTSDGGVFDSAGLLGTNNAIAGEEVSGTLYYSFLGREIDEDGDSWGGFNLWNADGGDEHFGIGNGGGPNDYVTYHHDRGEPPIGDPPTPIDGDVHLFVARVDFDGGVGAQDFYTVWLDPDPLLGESEQSDGISSDEAGTRAEDHNGFISYRMRGDNNSGQWEYDEVRFGLTWEDVTPTGGPLRQLEAGDADQDLDFDQLDIVAVQIASKYLTGNPATWGEGDWDGAPGGEPGSPPPGDGLFNQIDIIDALSPNHYLTGPYAALAGSGGEELLGDAQTSLVYDAGTGELKVDSPNDKDLTSINITSAGSLFSGDKPAVLDGAFDNFAGDNIFKATFGGSFGDISFGNVLAVGMSEEAVTADLTAVGSLAGGGDLGAVDLVYIPEPSAVVLLCLALAGALSTQRQRR